MRIVWRFMRMVEIPVQTKARVASIWLAGDIKAEATRIAKKYHRNASFSGLVEKLLRKEIRRIENAAKRRALIGRAHA